MADATAPSAAPVPFPAARPIDPVLRGAVVARARRVLESWGAPALPHQAAAWQATARGVPVLVTSGTGTGKTLAAFLGPAAAVAEGALPDHDGLRIMWITPMRALATDTARQLREAVAALGLTWTVETRTSDTPASMKRRQLTRLPHVLVTTPESATLLLSYRTFYDQLAALEAVVLDEWHELLSTMRGTQAELVLARLAVFRPGYQRIALTATIGNPRQALTALAGGADDTEGVIMAARLGAAAPGSYRLSYNDYGLELLSATPPPLEAVVGDGTLFADVTLTDFDAILRHSELQRHHFREVARVAILVHPGPPGRAKPLAQLQHTASLLYDGLCPV